MPIRVRVECHAGYRGEETPRALVFGGDGGEGTERRVEVAEVIDRWYGPDHRYFKLRGGDGAVYLVRHGDGDALWELVVWEMKE